MATLLESCRVAPPPGAVVEQSLPLTFSDIIWLPFHPIRRLLFYKFPCSNPFFLETLIPKLKESLSLTLKHFFPLAANIVYPLSPGRKPEIRYRAGDSVSLTIFEFSDDFDNLVENHARDADKFYNFIPQMDPTIEESDQKLLKVLALQVTLFPGFGVCIGFSNHHSIGDASSVVAFIKSWALINKLGGGGGEEQFLIESLPLYDRSLIKYPLELDSIYWNHVKNIPVAAPSFPVPTNRVRARYVFTPSELKKLKNLVQTRIPGLVHLSSFVVMSAYVWTCLAKSLTAGEEQKVKDDDEFEFFLIPVDFRARIDPPVPENYFGNCLSYALPKIKNRELVGEEGFFLAAEAIAKEIINRGINKSQILEGAEKRLSELGSVVRKPFISVSGSARVDLYSADFGWGKAKTMETLSIDGEKYAISLCRSRDCEGGLEVGLSLPKLKMEAFDVIFHGGIKSG